MRKNKLIFVQLATIKRLYRTHVINHKKGAYFMKTHVNICIFICIATLLLSGMMGCGETEEEKVSFTKAIPADGSTIQTDAEIIVTFDGTPTGLNVKGGKFSLSGVNATIKGPFTAGSLTLTLTWADGATVLTYTVEESESDKPDIAGPPEGMELIPAGEFRMGSNNDEVNEKPIHSVYVDAFYMDKHEVTNEQYAEFLNAKGKHAEAGNTWYDIGDSNPRGGQARIEYVSRVYRVKAGYAKHPVTFVSWYGAMAYAEWAGKRLPTEAEWEYAARGSLAGLKYPWGNSIDSTRANYGGNIDDTTAVGKYQANGYGLHDMIGNVREWCLDEYSRDFYAVSPSQNPIAGANSIEWIINNWTGVKTLRVSRGGSWGTGRHIADQAAREHTMRVTRRERDLPTITENWIGFRCVRAVSP
jgi:formylglycine-generating enzyme required for sulfatase activity